MTCILKNVLNGLTLTYYKKKFFFLFHIKSKLVMYEYKIFFCYDNTSEILRTQML